MPILVGSSRRTGSAPSADTAAERDQLQSFVKTIPFRTRTKTSNKVSDLTNLIFIGSPEALHRAFTAAGWQPSDDLNSASTFRTLKTLGGNQTYTQAPMSVLLLEERAPLFTLSKTTNTFSSRHHVRVFPTEEKWEGTTALTASSTQDIGIGFSRKQKTFIHLIDQHIDNERSKIINDLKFTGCVESLDMVPRPWVPNDAYNSTGDRLLTDRAVAVLHINACNDPKTTPSTSTPPPNRFERITRDTSLTIRNDVYRGNLIYQGIAGGIAVHNYLHNSSELPEDYGAWRKTDASGANYSVAGGKPNLHRRSAPPSALDTSPEDLAAIAKLKEARKWDPPHYEIALEGGYLHFRETDLSLVDILLTSDTVSKQYELDLFDSVDDGWAAGGTVTISNSKFACISNSLDEINVSGTGSTIIKYNTFNGGASAGVACAPGGQNAAISINNTAGSITIEYNYCFNQDSKCIIVSNGGTNGSPLAITERYNYWYDMGICGGSCSHGEAEYYYPGVSSDKYVSWTMEFNVMLADFNMSSSSNLTAPAALEADGGILSSPISQYNYVLAQGNQAYTGSRNANGQVASAALFCGHQEGGSVIGSPVMQNNILDYSGAFFPYNSTSGTCRIDFTAIADFNAGTSRSCNITRCN